MNHPPIPPNCPYFSEVNSKPVFMCPDLSFWWIERATRWPVVQYPELDKQRPIIAAVARCAWLDEARRIERLCYDIIEQYAEHTSEHGRYLSASHVQWAIYQKLLVAIKNANEAAEAWRVWGEAK